MRITDDKKYFAEYYHKTKRNIICECGVEICIKNRSTHYKTQLHNGLIKRKVQLHTQEDLGEIKILEELPNLDLDIHADENI